MDTGECLRVFRGHQRGVFSLIYVPVDDDENTKIDEVCVFFVAIEGLNFHEKLLNCSARAFYNTPTKPWRLHIGGLAAVYACMQFLQ